MQPRIGKTATERRENLQMMIQIANELPTYPILDSQNRPAKKNYVVSNKQLLKGWDKFGKACGFKREEVLKHHPRQIYNFNMGLAIDHLENLKEYYAKFGVDGIQKYLDKVKIDYAHWNKVRVGAIK